MGREEELEELEEESLPSRSLRAGGGGSFLELPLEARAFSRLFSLTGDGVKVGVSGAEDMCKRGLATEEVDSWCNEK